MRRRASAPGPGAARTIVVTTWWKDSLMRVLLVAPPGAGKGTQGALIATHFVIPRIATGDLLLKPHTARRRAGEVAKSCPYEDIAADGLAKVKAAIKAKAAHASEPHSKPANGRGRALAEGGAVKG